MTPNTAVNRDAPLTFNVMEEMQTLKSSPIPAITRKTAGSVHRKYPHGYPAPFDLGERPPWIAIFAYKSMVPGAGLEPA